MRPSPWILSAWWMAAGCMHPAFRAATPVESAGAPHRGYLMRGTAFPTRGVGFEVFRTAAQGGQAYGTSRLVGAIEQAAALVRRRAPGGAPLRVGDLSARRGGHIDHHASHRSGRDADLIFYALDEHGTSIPAPAFVRYDRDGHSTDDAYPLRFDVRRNWLLVDALVHDTTHGVIRIFCAEWLKSALLAYARSQGCDGDALARVDELLRQPGDSAPHDDHFHIRVACTPEERTQGCLDGAPMPWWLEQAWDKPAVASAMDDAALIDALGPPPPSNEPASMLQAGR